MTEEELLEKALKMTWKEASEQDRIIFKPIYEARQKELELMNKECDRRGTSSSSNSGGAQIKEVEVQSKPREPVKRIMMIRVVKENIEALEEEEEIEDQEPQEIAKTPEIDEERAKTPEPIKDAENEDQESESSDECHRKDNDKSVTEQQIFEKIHESLVYDTIERNLSNLIDVEPEGIYDSKEMTIELEKKMTFKFRVQTSHPRELKKSVRELINHFEGKLDYKLEKVTDSIEDSEEESFPQTILLRKETVTEEKFSHEGHNVMTTTIEEYKER